MYQSSWIHTSKFQKYRCSEFKLYPFENFLLLIQISMKNHSSHINLPKFTPPNSKNIHIPIRFFSKYFIIPHNPNSKNIVVPNLNYILLKIFFFQSKFQPHINLSQIYTSHPNSITFSFKHSSPPQTRPKFHESSGVICTLEPILSLQRRVPNRDWNPWGNRSRSSRRWHFTKLDIFRWSQRVPI